MINYTNIVAVAEAHGLTALPGASSVVIISDAVTSTGEVIGVTDEVTDLASLYTLLGY